jgi:adenylylsulfate kinase-like enzyme
MRLHDLCKKYMNMLEYRKSLKTELSNSRQDKQETHRRAASLAASLTSGFSVLFF